MSKCDHVNAYTSCSDSKGTSVPDYIYIYISSNLISPGKKSNGNNDKEELVEFTCLIFPMR